MGRCGGGELGCQGRGHKGFPRPPRTLCFSRSCLRLSGPPSPHPHCRLHPSPPPSPALCLSLTPPAPHLSPPTPLITWLRGLVQ